MKTPHKHAELIKAWADGAEIEFYDTRFAEHRWKLCGNPPVWDENFKYRIKPEPKPDIVKSFYAHANHHFQGMHISARLDDCHNLVLTFDGETGKLKSAEVL
jgi:hypothetical protein